MLTSSRRSSLPALELRELKVHSTNDGFVDPEILLANNISNIEKIHFFCLKAEHILLFVQKCVKLWEIKTEILDDVNSFDSVALNKERKELVGAGIITIYLNKLDYNRLVNMVYCELIKIKVLETSYE